VEAWHKDCQTHLKQKLTATKQHPEATSGGSSQTISITKPAVLKV